MSDTISRAAAIDAIVNTVSDVGLHDNSETARYGATFRQQEILTILESLPSANRPQGEWIYCEDEYGIDGYRCSNCGKHIPWDYQYKFINSIDDYHTCPFCDARMKGADDEND